MKILNFKELKHRELSSSKEKFSSSLVLTDFLNFNIFFPMNELKEFRLVLFSFFLIGGVFIFAPVTSASSKPEFDFANTIGGSGSDLGVVTTDENGNFYTGGHFTGTVDFDPGAGTDSRTSAGGTDAYLSKYSADGIYQWTKVWGGTGNDQSANLTTDENGNIYATGFFASTVDFDPGAGTDNQTSAGGGDAYLSKYSADGIYQWTKVWGGTGSLDSGAYVVVNESGQVYVFGRFSSTVDFDPGAGTDNQTSAGGTDIFVSRYVSDGTYVWTKSFGGTSAETAGEIIVDQNESVYITGRFTGTVDFDPGAGTDSRTSAGGTDAFLARYASDGTYVWTKSFGGTADDAAIGITTDQNESVYITGRFTGTVDFDPGAGTDNQTSAGGTDAFLARYTSDGTYVWTKSFGGTADENSINLSRDALGNIYVIGIFRGTVDFDPGAGTDNQTSAGGGDTFLARFNANGVYMETQVWGGSGDDVPLSDALDNESEYLYISGYFNSTVDFDPGVGVDEHTSFGDTDIFLSRFSLPEEPVEETEEESSSQKPKPESWKMHLSYNDSGNCSLKLKIKIKGSRFDDDIQVFLGSHEASSVDRKSSKELIASFCLSKLLSKISALEKRLYVKNPDTKIVRVARKADLALPQVLSDPNASFNQVTRIGIQNIQSALIHEKLLKDTEATGAYDQRTIEAVKVFQMQHGIPQTGNVGPKTAEVLKGILVKE